MSRPLLMLVVLSSILCCGSTTQISITPDTVSMRSPDLPSIQCVPGSLSSKTVLHMQIKKVGETEPIATVSQQNHNTTQTTPAVQVQADGLIQKGGSFLNVTFENIIPNMSGEYQCEITYFDEDGNVEKLSDTATLIVMPAWVDTLQDSMKEMIVQFKHLNVTIENQQNRINALELEQNQSRTSRMNSLEHNQQNQQNVYTSLEQDLINQIKSLTNRVYSLEEYHGRCNDLSWSKVGKLCYKAFHTQRLTWQDALKYCRARNGTLVQIDNQEMNDMVAGLMDVKRNTDYWIGANDINHEQHYEWPVSSPMQPAVPITETSYQNWWTGRSQDYGPGYDCVYMTTFISNRGKWWDARCAYETTFVCQTNTIYPPQ